MGELIRTEISKIPYLHIFGRTGRAKQPLPLFFNGSGIEVKVTGSELWIEIDTDCDNMEVWVACEINGALISRQMVLPGRQKICLFRSQEPTEAKVVRFYRELQATSENETTYLTVESLLSDGEFLKTDDYPLKLEFIGDSITSGEGTYGSLEDTVWVSMYMSASVNYATMVSKELHADYQLFSQGGWGVYCGWDNDMRHNIPAYYEKVCALTLCKKNIDLGAHEDYDFAYQPDVIVVNLGTNDNTAFDQPEFTDPVTGMVHKQHRNADGTYDVDDIAAVKKAVFDFITMLRKHHPASHIVWCYGMLGYALTLPITEAINDYRNKTGDNNVAFLNLPNTTLEECGSHMHPGYKSHKKAARVLVDYIKQVTGINI